MKPIETTEYVLEFAGPIAPGWLILLVPLAVLLGWLLYKTQFKDVARTHAVGLLVLRLLLLAGVVFLAFRPSLVHRRVLTYPGRILLVLDDSESMAARDNRTPPEEALYQARRLWPNEADARRQYHDLALMLSEVTTGLREFEAVSRTGDRTKDTFWEEAERAQDAISRKLVRLEELAAQAPPAGDAGLERLKVLHERLPTLRQELPALFTGDRHPGTRAFQHFYDDASLLREELLALQAVLDAGALGAGGSVLTEMLEHVRSRPRLELLGAKLGAALPSLPSHVPGQTVQVVRLTSGEVCALNRLKTQELKVVPGETDIVGRLNALIQERSDFPLTAIVLVSDGRDLGPGSPTALKQALARKAVPVYAAGIGDIREPLDIAVLDVVAPPFAVKGSPLRVKMHVKASLPEPREVMLEVLKGGQQVASSKLALGGREEQWVAAEFPPAELGLFRYTLRLESVPGETFPVENNSADFVAHVRPDKVKALLLDWKPRWETRFALNILRRLDYVELNPIIVLTQEGTTLKRGAEKGAWPDTEATLDTYDLVVLGDVPQDILSAAEWEALKAFVERKGKTICFLAPAPSLCAGPLATLLPLSAAPNAPALPDASEQALRVSDAGRFHPTTRSLGEGETAGGTGEAALEGAAPPKVATGGLTPDAQALLVNGSGRPVVACRFVGNGRTFLVGSDDLWRALNPTHLSAHGQLYVELVTWAVQAGLAPAVEGERARTATDGRVFDLKKGFQVWVYPQSGEARTGESAASPATASAPIVQAFAERGVKEGLPFAESPTEPAHEGAAVRRAAFSHLPRLTDGSLPDSVVFALKDRTNVATEPVLLLNDYDELKRLSQRRDFLEDLAASTGGAYREFVDFEELFSFIEPKQRIEKHESTWRLWDSAVVLAFLTGILTLEWVWRKLVGLV